MAIVERQLETWAQQGKTGQFTDTYKSIRDNLLDGSAPYPVKNVEVFLQGSYGNDTNVWADADVDTVLVHSGAFYYDICYMTPEEQEHFKAMFSKNAEYGYTKFKAHAEAWITRLYNGVQIGKKAVFVPGNNRRRNADIIVCEQFRRYLSYDSGLHNYHEGIAFYSDGTRIENFPKQHAQNCTAKHQATKGNFKAMVRVLKNMRNTMIEKGLIAGGVAPSYFVEGMLSNVPIDKFTGDYGDMLIACFNWVVEADESKLTTASGLDWLVRDNTPVCWPSANFRAFKAALKTYWES